MKSKIEKWYPLTLGLIITILYCSYFSKNLLPESWKEILSAVTTLSGIAIGFISTAMSILFTISSSNIVQQIIKTNNYDKLINYFLDAINLLFLLILLSLIGLFIDIKALGHTLQVLASGVWIFALITSGLSSYRVIRVFASVLRAAKN